MRHGLRQPIEVWQKQPTGDGGPVTYGLISGYRRLTIYNEMAELDKFKTIPAFIRQPETLSDAMIDMVAENEIRAQISPWDRARVVVEAVDDQIYDTIDAAIDALHRTASSQKKSRLRTLCAVVAEFMGMFRDPHHLSERKLMRLAALQRTDMLELAHDTIAKHRPRDADATYELILPIVEEAEQRLAGNPRLKRPRNPVRMKALAEGMYVRREYRPDGWALVLTGPRATGMLAKEAMDEIIWKLSPPD